MHNGSIARAPAFASLPTDEVIELWQDSMTSPSSGRPFGRYQHSKLIEQSHYPTSVSAKGCP